MPCGGGIRGARVKGWGADGTRTIMLKNRTMCSPFVTVLMSDGAKLRRGWLADDPRSPERIQPKVHRESTPIQIELEI